MIDNLMHASEAKQKVVNNNPELHNLQNHIIKSIELAVDNNDMQCVVKTSADHQYMPYVKKWLYNLGYSVKIECQEMITRFIKIDWSK